MVFRHCKTAPSRKPKSYFALLDAAVISPELVLSQKAKDKERRSWINLKTCTSDAAKFVNTEWCVRKSVKTSNLSVSQWRQFFHLEPPYTKITLLNRSFKEKKAFTRLENYFW